MYVIFYERTPRAGRRERGPRRVAPRAERRRARVENNPACAVHRRSACVRARRTDRLDADRHMSVYDISCCISFLLHRLVFRGAATCKHLEGRCVKS